MNMMDEAFTILQYIFNGVLQLFNRVWVFFGMESIIIPALFISVTFGFLLGPILLRGNYGSSDSVKNSKRNKGGS